MEDFGRLIYLASTYTHPDLAVQEQRFEAVCEAGAKLMSLGVMIYAPIAHSHPMTKYGVPGHWEFWAAYDKLVISKCAEVWILMLEGWTKSVGITAEIKLTKELGVPIRYIELQDVLDGTLDLTPLEKCSA